MIGGAWPRPPLSSSPLDTDLGRGLTSPELKELRILSLLKYLYIQILQNSYIVFGSNAA